MSHPSEESPPGPGLTTLDVPAAAEQLNRIREAVNHSPLSRRPLLIRYAFVGRDQLLAFLVPLWLTEGSVVDFSRVDLEAAEKRYPDGTVRSVFAVLDCAQWLETHACQDAQPQSEDVLPCKLSAREAGVFTGEPTSSYSLDLPDSLRFVDVFGKSEEELTAEGENAAANQNGQPKDQLQSKAVPFWLRETVARASEEGRVLDDHPVVKAYRAMADAAQASGLDSTWKVAWAAWPGVPKQAEREKQHASSANDVFSRALGIASEESELSNLDAARTTYLRTLRRYMMQWVRGAVGRHFLQPWLDAAAAVKEWGEAPTEIVVEPHGILHVLPLQTASVIWPWNDTRNSNEENHGRERPLIEYVPVRRIPNSLALPYILPGREMFGRSADPGGTSSGSAITSFAPAGRVTTVKKRPTAVLILGPPDRYMEAQIKEVRSLETVVGSDRAVQLSGKKMTLAAMQHALEEHHPKVIHIATHGTYDYRDPLESTLQMGPDQPALRARQLIEGDIDLTGVQLAYLSSCWGGYGEPDYNDELMGTIYALLVAGARCVVTHLYPVQGEVAAATAHTFYNTWMQGETAAKAYRTAVLQASQRDTWRKPYMDQDWMGYALHGDPTVQWFSATGASSITSV